MSATRASSVCVCVSGDTSTHRHTQHLTSTEPKDKLSPAVHNKSLSEGWTRENLLSFVFLSFVVQCTLYREILKASCLAVGYTKMDWLFYLT